MRRFCWFILLLLMLGACHHTSLQLSFPLKQAELQIRTNPDHVLILLDSIKNVVRKNEYHYAVWSLLKMEVLEGEGIEPLPDSLVDNALNYFKKSSDTYRKAKAFYYAGRKQEKLHKSDDAISYYLQAKEAAIQSRDYLFLSQICLRIGRLYGQEGIKEESLKFLREAHHYAQVGNDSLQLAHTLLGTGLVYSKLSQEDSALIVYQKCYDLACFLADWGLQGRVQVEMAHVYNRIAHYEEALKKLYAVRQLCHEKNLSRWIPYLNFSLGKTYRMMNKKDSATIYLKAALPSEEIEIKAKTYLELYLLNKERDSFQEAIYYGEQFYLYEDSLHRQIQGDKLEEINAKYHTMKLQKANDSLKIEKAYMVKKGFTFLVCILITISLIIFYYQRMLLYKERLLRSHKEKMEADLLKLRENEETIKKNEALITSITTQLEQSSLLKEQVKEQRNHIRQLQGANEGLAQDNKQLTKDIAYYNTSLKEHITLHRSLKDLATQITFLKEREKTLSDYLFEHVELFTYLRTSRRYITEEEWPEIRKVVNIIYGDFTRRLHVEYPTLTENDLQLGCLIRLKCTTSTIATLIGISPSSVTKRKQRMKERMAQQHPSLWANGISLETYLCDY